MQDRFILTPYFLDQHLPALDPVAKFDWFVNRPDLPEGSTQERMINLYRPLADEVVRVVREGQRPISIAGDCCATIGYLAGLQRGGIQPTLIWFDAHGDFNTWETTPSGFLGGMPLAMIAGLGERSMPAGVLLQPVPAQRVILTDGRDLDDGERMLVQSSGIIHLPSVTDLFSYPIPDGPLYVHFDVDILRTADMPAVNYPATGGPNAATLRAVFRHLAQTGNIAAVSVSTWTVAKDADGRSRDLTMDLLQELLG